MTMYSSSFSSPTNLMTFIEASLISSGWTVTIGPATTGQNSEIWVKNSAEDRFYMFYFGQLASYFPKRTFSYESNTSYTNHYTTSISSSIYMAPADHGMYCLSVISCDSFSATSTNRLDQENRTPDTCYTGYFSSAQAGTVYVLCYGNNITLVIKLNDYNYLTIHAGDMVLASSSLTSPAQCLISNNYIPENYEEDVTNVSSAIAAGLSSTFYTQYGWTKDEYPTNTLTRLSKAFLMPPMTIDLVADTDLNSNLDNSGYNHKKFVCKYGIGSALYGGSAAPYHASKDLVKAPNCFSGSACPDWAASFNYNSSSWGYMTSLSNTTHTFTDNLVDIVDGDFGSSGLVASPSYSNSHHIVLMNTTFMIQTYTADIRSTSYGFCRDPLAFMLAIQSTAGDNKKILIPIEFSYRGVATAVNTTTNDSATTLIGYAEGVRAVNHSDLEAMQTLYYGAEKWLVVPDVVTIMDSGKTVNSSNALSNLPHIDQVRPWIAVRYE